MNKRFHLSSKLFLSACVAVLAALVLLAPAAQATPYVVKLTQQGSNVVATGSGAFDLSGLSYVLSGGGGTDSIYPGPLGFVLTGLPAHDVYVNVSGPSAFGTSSVETYAGSESGSGVGITYSALYVPIGYVSGTPLSSSATWNNASFASLGVTLGTYVWKWGAGTGEQTFTLLIGNAVSAPEPAVLGMFGCGLLLIGAFVERRRRVA